MISVPGVHSLTFLNDDGAFGDIFLGQDAETGNRVVVKFLRDVRVPGALKGFRREIRILKRKIRGYVRLLWSDLRGEAPYYVMQYAEGGTLERHAGRLLHAQQIKIFRTVADTLGASHRAQIMHGDLKPANILITGGTAVLSDPLGNGAGCTVTLSTKVGGTPGYCAPEVWNHRHPVSAASDVFSFGATMFHVATGIAPTIQMAVTGAWPFPANMNADLRQLVIDTTRLRPSDRPSIVEIRFRLMALDIPAPSYARVASKTAMSNPWPPLAIGVGLLLLMIFAASK